MSRESFFGSLEEDEHLEVVNRIFWRSLLGHVRAELDRSAVSTILDVGCHHGGLLELLASHFRPRRLIGLEPMERARDRARFRLARSGAETVLLPPEEWPGVSSGSVDLVICHETLHLVEDLGGFMVQVERVLRPEGRAFLVLGSHAENPLWLEWKKSLQAEGHQVFDHQPFDVLAAASHAGLHGAVRPLRRDGWVIYDPTEAEYRYPSAEVMFDHHYRHKLLFRLHHSGGQLR